MSELIIYEDSPLAQYLEEVDAAEGIVAEEIAQAAILLESDASKELMVRSQQNKLKGILSGLFKSNSSSYRLIAFSLLEASINILGNSGLLADRYTPRPLTKACLYEESSNMEKLELPNNGFRASNIARLVVPSAIGGGMALKSTAAGTRLHSALCIALVAGIGAAGIALSSSILGQVRLDSAMKRVSGFRNKLLDTVHICRQLDSMIQRCIKSVQEVEFIYRGFRLPNYAGALNTSSTPGQGALWAASHLCKTTNDVLASVAMAILELLDKEDGLSADVLYAVSEYRKRIEAIEESERRTLDTARLQFDICFALRRIWLGAMLSSLDALANSRPGFSSICGCIDKYIGCLSLIYRVCVDGVGAIKDVQEARYASKRWETVVSGQFKISPDTNPLTRSLGTMADTMETIQTKLSVCRDYVDQLDQKVHSEDVARIFSSLKADIDMLNASYQLALTALVCDEQQQVSRDLDASSLVEHSWKYEDDMELLPEGARVFGYTPLDSKDLDAPSLEFEADFGSEQEVNMTKRSVVDRSERIRLQREKREAEKQISEKKSEIRSMIFELKSAIETRSSSKDNHGGHADHGSHGSDQSPTNKQD